MQINFTSTTSTISPYARWSSGTTAAADSTSALKVDTAAQQTFVNTHALNMGEALERIRESWRNSHIEYEREAATAASGSAVDFGAATAAALRSAEEVNASPTSFSTAGPPWDNFSSALVTVDGEYDGSNGSGAITLNVIRGGVIGTNYTRVGVWAPDGQKIEDIVLSGSDPAGTPYELSNGLIISFGSGFLTPADTMSFDVFADVGGVVDPNAAFNGVRQSDPNLQYGFEIGDGSFKLNDVLISVDEADSINTIMMKINDSGAGLIAEFDAASERVVLRQETPGADAGITLDSDTSGFLAAMKLDTAVVEDGSNAPDLARTMADVSALAAVSSGALLINGVSVAFDRTLDSLQDLIERINESDAGVEAEMDAEGEIFSITATNDRRTMVIDDQDTGLFDALKVDEKSYRPERNGVNEDGMSREVAAEIADALEVVAESMNALFAGPQDGSAPAAFLTRMQGAMHSAVAEAFDDNGDTFRSSFGIEFDFDEVDRGVFDFDRSAREDFITAAIDDTEEMNTIFFADARDDEDGLVGLFTSIIEEFGASGAVGGLLDSYA